MVSSARIGDEIREGRDLNVWDLISSEVWRALPHCAKDVNDLWRAGADDPLTGVTLHLLLARLLTPAQIDALPTTLRARLPEWPVGTLFESADDVGMDWTLRGYGLVTGDNRVCDIPCALMEPRGRRAKYVPLPALHGPGWTVRGAWVLHRVPTMTREEVGQPPMDRTVVVPVPADESCRMHGCGKRVAYSGAIYCGAACCAMAESRSCEVDPPEQIEPLSPADDVQTSPEGEQRTGMPVDMPPDDGVPFYRCRACGVANEATGENTWNHPAEDTEACLHAGKILGRGYVAGAHERDGLEMAIGALAYAIDPGQPGEVLSELRLFAAALLLRAREADPVQVARPQPESREAQLETALRDVLAAIVDTEDEDWAIARARKLVPGLPGDACRVTAARLREDAARWVTLAAERDRAVAS